MDETPFRIAIGGLLLIMGTGRWLYGRHWWRARKKIVGRKTELVFLLLAFLPGTACLALYLVSSWLDAFHVVLPVWLRLVGGAMFLMGDLLFVWTHKTLGRNWSPMLEIMENHTLVTTGPYAYARHPLYAAALVIALGMSLFSANWLLALTWTGGSILVFACRMPAEEAMMVGEFGERYREYVRCTGRLFPILRRPQ